MAPKVAEAEEEGGEDEREEPPQTWSVEAAMLTRQHLRQLSGAPAVQQFVTKFRQGGRRLLGRLLGVLTGTGGTGYSLKTS